jgi:hypothetical protein
MEEKLCGSVHLNANACKRELIGHLLRSRTHSIDVTWRHELRSRISKLVSRANGMRSWMLQLPMRRDLNDVMFLLGSKTRLYRIPSGFQLQLRFNQAA